MIFIFNRKTKQKCQKTKKNKNNYIGPWTIKEDRTLIQLVEQQGPCRWNFIANYLPGRTGKQCRERWCNHLCPDINKSSWSLEEEMLLLLIHTKIGNKWSELAKYLKGRTDNTIKNHWNSAMKKKLKFVQESLKNKKIEIKNRYKENKDENIERLIIDEFTNIIETQMKKIFDDKKKNYENFKKIKIDLNNNEDDNNNMDNNNNISFFSSSKNKNKNKEINDDNNSINNVLNLRKILGFRTHSKKRKKIGDKNNLSSSKKKKNNKKVITNKNKKEKYDYSLERKIIENIDNKEIIKNKDNNINYKTPNMNKIINKISSSIKETEENSGKNKIPISENNISAFRSINREDNSSDKKLLLSHKYTPVKIITQFDELKNNDNKSENNNNNLDLKTSKKNLSLLFNNID